MTRPTDDASEWLAGRYRHTAGNLAASLRDFADSVDLWAARVNAGNALFTTNRIVSGLHNLLPNLPIAQLNDLAADLIKQATEALPERKD